jgi:hypothetical protein
MTVAAMTPAQATLLFTFDCSIVNATTCTTGGGPFGTLTVTDSAVDANRVDFSVILNGPNILAKNSNFTGLNNFYLNYSGPTPANSTFNLVFVTDPIQTTNNGAGDAAVNLNSQGPSGTTLDILLNPAGSVPSLTYTGSLVLYSNLSGHAETNLDSTMFMGIDANNLLYAAFDTLPTNHTYAGGASGAPVVQTNNVPEPASLALLGAGLAGLGVRRRKRKAA